MIVAAGCKGPLEVGQQAPDFSLPRLEGGAVSLSDLRGKTVFVHFWATWCPPCVVELPRIARFIGTLSPDRYALAAVCVDEASPARIRDFLEAWGYEIPVCLDPGGRLARKYGTYRYPETYVIDREGVLRRKVIGANDWDRADWVRFLQSIKKPTDSSERRSN